MRLFRLEVEDVGIVSGGLNSQLDWNLDLNTCRGSGFNISKASFGSVEPRSYPAAQSSACFNEIEMSHQLPC